MDENIHEKHRHRMRERYRKYGAAGLTHHEILEMILYYSLPRCDTNELAHRLIKTFGSFSGVLEANVDDIAEVKGVGVKTAIYLKLFLDVSKIYEIDKSANNLRLYTIDHVGSYLQPYFIGKRSEVVMLLCLDAQNKVLAVREVLEGSINSANFDVKQVVATALSLKATSIVLAHNHPGGEATPSSQDVTTTVVLGRVLKKLNIRFVDHLIFAGDDYVSLAQSENLFKKNDEKNEKGKKDAKGEKTENAATDDKVAKVNKNDKAEPGNGDKEAGTKEHDFFEDKPFD